jgi:hypothetical protein
MPHQLWVKLCENWLLWNFTEEENKSSIPSLSAPTTLNLWAMKNHITPASLSWAHGLSHGNLHSQLTISMYENHPNSHKSILGSCTKREKKNNPKTTHCEYILTILGLFWSQINSPQSSHKNGYFFLAKQNPQYPNNVAFLSTPNPIAMKNRFENLSNLHQ